MASTGQGDSARPRPHAEAHARARAQGQGWSGAFWKRGPNVSERRGYDWANDLAYSATMTVVMHPIGYAKILMQVGHEPIAPVPCNTFFGQPALLLPNLFKYLRHIKRRDGFLGLYRGCPESLCSMLAARVTERFVADLIDWGPYRMEDEMPPEAEDEEDRERERDMEDKEAEDFYRQVESRPKTEKTRQLALARRVSRQVVTRAAAVVASHPFHVIMCRTMAQFVGRETRYSNVFGSVGEVYRTNGVPGFFAGLVPRLVGEVSTLVLVEYAKHWALRLIKDPNGKSVAPYVINMVVMSFTYPMTVVSNCMAINNCGLAAGLPPQMPVYPHWTDCYRHLKSIGQASRGSSMINRYYATGATAVILGANLKHGEL